ncbi:MAG: PorV/PorQ family protein [Bacteroidia bacterium]
MKKGIVIILFVSGIFSAKAQLAPKYSNEFLSIGVGARAAGMGDAVIASVNDATSGYWNPAALMEIKDNIQVALMHNELFAGISKEEYVGLSFKLNDKSVIGLSVIRNGVDDIPNTLNLMQNGQIDYSLISSFSAVDYGFIGSYARKMNIEGLSLGGNVKVIRRVIGDFANAWGFGFDAGAKYNYGNWKFAATVRDVTSTFNVWTYTFTDQQKQILLATDNALPSNNLELTLPKLTIAAARKWAFFKDKFTVLAETDWDINTDGQRNVLIHSSYFNIDPKLGFELGYANIVFLRGGMNNIQQAKQIDGTTQTSVVPTLGIGIKLNNLCLDYALANVGSASGLLPYSNIISLRLSFNRKP